MHRLLQVDIDRREQCCAAKYEQVVNQVVKITVDKFIFGGNCCLPSLISRTAAGYKVIQLSF